MAATPVTHSAVRASRLGSGPAPSFMAPAMALGFAISTGVVVGSISRSAFQLRTYAWLRSLDACSTVTPGFRRAIISSQPQL